MVLARLASFRLDFDGPDHLAPFSVSSTISLSKSAGDQRFATGSLAYQLSTA
jgi:hypothetical protein